MRRVLAGLLSPLLITLMLAPLIVLLVAPFDAQIEAVPFQGAAASAAGGGGGGGALGARRLQQTPAASIDTSTLTNYTGDAIPGHWNRLCMAFLQAGRECCGNSPRVPLHFLAAEWLIASLPRLKSSLLNLQHVLFWDPFPEKNAASSPQTNWVSLQ